MITTIGDYESARLISKVLTMYYIEDKSQSEIAHLLNLSTAKINRLIKQARNQGLVEIKLHTPLQQLFDLEREFVEVTGVKKAVIVPRLVDHPAGILQAVGQAAANYLLEHLRDGDTVCISGGNALDAMVQNFPLENHENVLVVPAIGGVQGRNETDVNRLVAELAKRLGAHSFLLHAPAWIDSVEERDSLMALRQIKEVIDFARNAQVAVIGIGAIRPATASYFRFMSVPPGEIEAIINDPCAAGQVLGHIINKDGKLCLHSYEGRVVSIELEDLLRIPLTIGVAALEEKAVPIAAALRGGYIKTLVTDEVTARCVLDIFSHTANGHTA